MGVTLKQEQLQQLVENIVGIRAVTGVRSDGSVAIIRTQDDGYIPVKLMAYDVDATGGDIQVACDSQGRLKSSAQIYAAVDEVEKRIGATQKYSVYRVDNSGDPLYVVYEDEDGEWYCMRYNSSTGAMDFAVESDNTGSSAASDAYTNRASLTYYSRGNVTIP